MKEGKTNAREDEITPLIRRWPGYTVAVAGTAVAALITWAPPSAGKLPLYLTFFPAVLAAAVVGGTGPSVLATILSVLTANLLFIEQGGNLVFGANAQTTRLALFIAINFAISVLGGRFRAKSVALRENEARLRHFIDQAPVAIAMLDTRMHYLAASRRWLAAR
jgi:K+-sensing histidine kinase KdpD